MFILILIFIEDPTRMERSICWANPDLLPLMKQRQLSCYFDGTFKCVPKPFKQLLILMVYDPASGISRH